MGPWSVKALQPMECAEAVFRRLRWRHSQTHLTEPTALAGQRRGQTIWGAKWGGGILAMAWDWAEVRPWVIVLSDPMQILTNVEIDLTEELETGYTSACVMVLNDTVHRLPWQAEVVRKLRGTEAKRPYARGLARAA